MGNKPQKIPGSVGVPCRVHDKYKAVDLLIVDRPNIGLALTIYAEYGKSIKYVMYVRIYPQPTAHS